MQTLNLTRATLLAASCVASACNQPECVDDADCPLGTACGEAGTCFQVGPPITGGGGGGGGEGEGEGEGEALSPVPLPGSLQTLQPGSLGPLGLSAGQPSGTVLVGLYESGTRDEILFFDPRTGALPSRPGPGAGIDLLGSPLVTTSCGFDHASVQVDYGVRGIDELWLSCNVPTQRVLQVRTESFEGNIVAANGIGADFIIALGADAVESNIFARRVYAARGDGTLYVERRRDNENEIAEREQDTTPPFGAIAGLTLVAREDLNRGHGDLVAVFDRAWPATSGPALVIVERQSPVGANTDWQVYSVNGRPQVLELPAATHAVRLGPIPDPLTLATDAASDNTVNLEVYEPTAGKVEFGRYETAIASGQPFSALTAGGFNPISLTGATLPTATPPPTDRILLLPTSDNAVFYVLTNKQVGWKVPLHQTRGDGRDNEVRITTFNNADATTLPMGIIAVPNSTTTVWLGMRKAGAVGSDQLLPVVFDQ